MSTEQAADKDPESHLASARNRAVAIVLAPIIITLIWALGTILTTKPETKTDTRPEVAIGRPAPGFTYPLLGGGTMGLADHRGKVVLVNVWATWCPPCIEEMPDLQNLYTKMKAKGAPFEILGVSIDALGGDVVQKWVDRFGITFPILLDPRGSVKKLYRTTGVPETFIIGPGGRLERKFIGPRKWDGPEMIGYLDSLIPSGTPKPGAVRPGGS